MAKLTLTDIADTRAYERERPEFLARIIELKKQRRIHVGPIVTFVFENRETIRFQVQEMARVERMATDEAIEHELATYNPLIPEPGRLAATMLIELTSDDALRDWLPKLVGIETEVELRLGAGPGGAVVDGTTIVRCEVDPEHAKQLTREDVTASVHYVHFALDPDEVARFAAAPVALAVTHAAYAHATLLSEENRTQLLADLRGDA